MKTFIYPKSKTEKLNHSLFNRDPYLITGYIILFLMIFFFLFAAVSYKSGFAFLHYNLNLEERLEEPALLSGTYENENKDDFDDFFEEPSSGADIYLFGTNSEGRDLFTNLILGLEIYFLGGAIALSIALFLGTFIGSISAYYSESIFSKILLFIELIIKSFPKIVLLFLALIIFEFSIYTIMIAVGILSSVKISGAVYQKVINLKKQEFIDSARQLGLGDFKILLKHILYYNSRDIFIVYSVYILADVILLETTLAYLNFGVIMSELATGLDVKSWGLYLAEGKKYISQAYWIVLFPALFILFTISALNFIGDGLKEKLHVK